MHRRTLVGVLAALVLFLFAKSASAQATRTWVSGVGDDANPCSRTAPCKTFAGAISKTAAAGVIDVLDPGGYGAVTITKSITIDGRKMAGVLVSGTNGIIVNAGANDTVILRGLAVDGLGTGLSSTTRSACTRAARRASPCTTASSAAPTRASSRRRRRR